MEHQQVMLDERAARLAASALDEQLAAFVELTLANPVVPRVLDVLDRLALPGGMLVAGGLFQTVWNVLSSRPPGAGIRDYDVFYCDPDTSWEAEDGVIRRAAAVAQQVGLDPAVLEVRNEARVHLWYQDKYGVPCPAYTSSQDAIDRFPATTCCYGMWRDADGRLRVYAPHGFTDLFSFVLRPNPVQAPGAIYAAKAERWRHEWPALTVLPWPSP